jgi:hypothetical protein
MKNGRAVAAAFASPVFEFESASLQSPGMAIFGKEIRIDRLKVEKGTIRHIALRDGSTNWDALQRSSLYRTPVQNDLTDWEIRSIALNDCSVMLGRESSSGNWLHRNFSGINMNASGWEAEGAAESTLESDFQMQLTDSDGTPMGQISTRFAVELGHKLSGSGILTSAQFRAFTEDVKADGLLAESDGIRWALDVQFENQLISPLRLTASHGDKELFRLTSIGRFDPSKKELSQDISYEGQVRAFNVFLPDHQLVLRKGEIAGRATAFVSQFGNTQVLSHKGTVTDIESTWQSFPFKPVSGAVNLTVTHDSIQQSVRLDTVDLQLTTQENNGLYLRTEKAVNFSYGKSAPGFARSSLLLDFQAELSDWKPLLPAFVVSGKAMGTGSVLVDQDGRSMQWDARSTVAELKLQSPENPDEIQSWDATVLSSGPIVNYNTLDNGFVEMILNREGQPEARVRAGLLLLGDSGSSTTTLDIRVENLNRLEEMIDIPMVSTPTGRGSLNLSINRSKNGASTATAGFLVENFSGGIFGYDFEEMRADGEFRVDFTSDAYKVQSARLEVYIGTESALSCTGSYHRDFLEDSTAGEINVHYLTAPIFDILRPKWMSTLDMAEINLNSKTKIQSMPGRDNGIGLKTSLEVKAFRPTGFNASMAAGLYLLANGGCVLMDDSLSIDTASFRFSELSQGNTLVLDEASPVNIPLRPGDSGTFKSAGAAADPIPVHLVSQSLFIDPWIELVNYWADDIARNGATASADSLPWPIELKLECDQITQLNSAGDQVVTSDWSRSAVLMDRAEIPSRLRNILPNPLRK